MNCVFIWLFKQVLFTVAFALNSENSQKMLFSNQ